MKARVSLVDEDNGEEYVINESDKEVFVRG